MPLQKPAQGVPAQCALADALSFPEVELLLTPGTQLSSCSCALGSSPVHRGQKKLCWCPLEGQQVPVWCAEPQPYGALSIPNLGSPHRLQVLCNPAGKLTYLGHLRELKSQLKFSSARDLMCFCHLVASVPLCPAWTVQCSHEQQGNLVFVPRDKLAVSAAVEGLF